MQVNKVWLLDHPDCDVSVRSVNVSILLPTETPIDFRCLLMQKSIEGNEMIPVVCKISKQSW